MPYSFVPPGSISLIITHTHALAPSKPVTRQESMILLETLLCRIVQTDHMPGAHRDEIITSRGLGEKRTSLRLRALRPVAASSGEAKHVVAVARDDVNRSRGSGRFFEPAADRKQFPEADDVFLVEILLEDALVVRAWFSPEVAAAARLRGGDEVGWVVAGEARGVECCGKGDGLREVGGDGDDGDAVAGEDEGGDVGGVIGRLGVAEDGAVGVSDVDDAVECSTWWSCKSRVGDTRHCRGLPGTAVPAFSIVTS